MLKNHHSLLVRKVLPILISNPLFNLESATLATPFDTESIPALFFKPCVEEFSFNFLLEASYS